MKEFWNKNNAWETEDFATLRQLLLTLLTPIPRKDSNFLKACVRASYHCVIIINCYQFYSIGKSTKELNGEEKKDDGELWCNIEAQAAFLGPNLWDKTLPYDTDFKEVS